MELSAASFSGSKDTNKELDDNLISNNGYVKCLMNFPQAIFLLKQNMELIENNEHGKTAIANAYVGLSINQKLYFKCKESDNYVKEIIHKLRRNYHLCSSEKFILRNSDMQHRVCTIALESPNENSNLVLTIHEGEASQEKMMQSLARVYKLTRNESDIIKMMVQRLKPKEIAYELGISLNTVRSHLLTLYAKMQVHSYNEAQTKAIKLVY